MNIPADTYNAFIDAAQNHINQQANQVSRSLEALFSKTHNAILIRNDSGADRVRFDILGIDSPVLTFAENPVEFQNRVAMKGVVPAAEHNGKFVILLEPIPANAFGNAWISGIALVHVDIQDEAHAHADVAAGDPSALESSDDGTAQIIWKEVGTGVKWAVVRLGSPAVSSGGGTRFAKVPVNPTPSSPTILVQPVKVDDSGVVVDDGARISVPCWPGLVGDDFRRAFSGGYVIGLRQDHGIWFAEQTMPWFIYDPPSGSIQSNC